jgi:hypothetical protein
MGKEISKGLFCEASGRWANPITSQSKKLNPFTNTRIVYRQLDDRCKNKIFYNC